MGDFSKNDALIGLGAAIGLVVTGGLGGALIGASTVFGVQTIRKSAKAQENELLVQQRKEEQAGRDREVLRKRRTAALLGTQAAQAAAAGVELSGSVGNISIVDASRASEESMIDSVNTRARVDALKRQRTTISNMSTFRQATTILGAGERFAQLR